MRGTNQSRRMSLIIKVGFLVVSDSRSPTADLNTPHGTTLPQHRIAKTTQSDECNKYRSLQQIQLAHQ